MAKITKNEVDKAAPLDRDFFIWDNELKGFGLKVTKAAKKVFLVQYRMGGRNGRTRRMTIGSYGTLTVDQARLAARSILKSVALGIDPMAERDDQRNDVSLGELIEVFLQDHAATKLKPRSAIEYARLIKTLVPQALLKQRVKTIERPAIAKLHSAHSSTPYQANRLLAVLRKFFGWCEQNGYRADYTNPTNHIQKFKEAKRKRYLSGAELAALGVALAEVETEAAHSPYIVAALRLLTFTGARLNEILMLEWGMVDFDNCCLNLPDSKTGEKVIFLNSPALAVLSKLPRLEGNPFVICGQKTGCRLINLQKPWTAIRNRAGLDDVRLHDLRHSFASIAVANGMSLPLIGGLLGHTQAQTTQRYAHLSQDPQKAANDLIGHKIADAMGVSMFSNVENDGANIVQIHN